MFSDEICQCKAFYFIYLLLIYQTAECFCNLLNISASDALNNYTIEK